MRDRIELGKRQVQKNQWGSQYALNEDMSMKAKLASMARRIEEFELRNVHLKHNHKPCQLHLTYGRECPTIPTMRDMYGYQSSYTSSWNNHPNLATQPQPQPSMSTSSLEQAILKISKVMEDFVVLMIDTLVGIAMKTLWTNLSLKIIRFKRIKGYLNPLKHPLLQEEKRNEFLGPKGRMPILFGIRGIKHEVGVHACKNRNGGETEESREPKCISKALGGISHHEHTRSNFSMIVHGAKRNFYTFWKAKPPGMLSSHLNYRSENFRTLFILVRNDFQANF
ncbi:hypothetical protein AAG906_039199 [Vitis piasezkii]